MVFKPVQKYIAVRPAKTVNALFYVADDKNIISFDKRKYGFLYAVRVLVFVDENILIAPGDLFARFVAL